MNSIEGLFGNRSRAEKKESAISFVGAALELTEAVANREIVDEAKIQTGLGASDRRHCRLPQPIQLGTREATVSSVSDRFRITAR